MPSQWIFKNGKQLMQVHDIDTVCENLKELYNSQEKQLIHLQRQMKELADENWKDTELQKMRDELKSARAELGRGFGISEAEAAEIEAWRLQHMEKRHGCKTLEDRLRAGGAIGGSMSYEFVPTSIGVVGTVYCGACRRKAFQDANGDYEKYRRLRKEYDSEMEFQSL